MASGGPSSHEEICGFEHSIARPVQPQIGAAFVRTINPNFARTIQVGLPPNLALVLQYQKGNLGLQGVLSADGSARSMISYAVRPNLMYALNVMCAPAPDSFEVCRRTIFSL